jgi:hypothetical protein
MKPEYLAQRESVVPLALARLTGAISSRSTKEPPRTGCRAQGVFGKLTRLRVPKDERREAPGAALSLSNDGRIRPALGALARRRSCRPGACARRALSWVATSSERPRTAARGVTHRPPASTDERRLSCTEPPFISPAGPAAVHQLPSVCGLDRSRSAWHRPV